MLPTNNERLCRVGAQTDMGKLVRRFWVPACLSSDLPKPGGAPIRITLFNQHFAAFRGADGKLGLLDELCMHRGASLLLARNEDSALRCIYHGWKFARDGAILEMPNALNEKAIERFRAGAYPVEEASGIVWVYLGPKDDVPPRPRYLWESFPAENFLALPVDLDCNWVQALEGLVDSAHTGVLHEDVITKNKTAYGDYEAMRQNFAPRLELEHTDFGFHYAAIRSGAGMHALTDQIRVTAYIAPFLCLIPPEGQAFMAVPIDDQRTRFFNIWWSRSERLDSGAGYAKRIEMWGLSQQILQATGMAAINPKIGEPVPRNVFRQDRDAMESGRSFSGLPGVTAEDGAISVSMGAIAPRDNEHLVESDIAVVQLRRLLLAGAKRLAEGGKPACSGGATPSLEITAASGSLAPGADWRTLVPRHVAMAGRGSIER
jgi:phthalate 4,5-dioxygenase oxygenase subunit